MTAVGFEVAAILDVVDKASPKLERVLALSTKLAETWERMALAGKGMFTATGGKSLSAQLEKMNRSLEKLGPIATASFREFEAAAGGALNTLRGINTEMRAAVASTRALGRVPVPPGGGRGGGGGHNSPTIPSPIPGPFGGHLSTRSSIGLVAGGAAAYGAYEEGKLRDTAARMLFLAGKPLDANMSHTDQFQAVRKILLDVYTGTGAELGDIEEGAIGSTKLMAGFPIEQRMAILKKSLMFGAQEHRLNPQVSVREGTDALIGLLHMTGVYDPDQIDKLAPKIGALSTITNMPLTSVMRAASYAMPIAQANIGVDPNQILLLMTAMQRAGVTNTKSGTWLREALTKTVTDTFTLTAHGSEKQKDALGQLGLVDKNGKSTVFDDAGHLDIFKELQLINEAKQKLKGPDFLRFTRQAFGVQGSEGIGVLTEPQIMAQMPAMRNWMNTMAGGEAFFKDLFDASPAQQAKNTLAEFNRTLMDVGSTALPAVTDSLKLLDKTLHGLNETLEHTPGVPDASNATSWAMVGGAGLLFGPTRRLAANALRFGGRMFGMGGGAEAAGAGAGETVLGGTMVPIVAPLLVGAAAGGLQYHNQTLARQNPGVAGYDPETGRLITGNLSANPETQIVDKIVDAIKSLIGSLTVNMDGTRVGRVAIDKAVRRYQAAPGDTGSPSGEMTPILNGGN